MQCDLAGFTSDEKRGIGSVPAELVYVFISACEHPSKRTISMSRPVTLCVI